MQGCRALLALADDPGLHFAAGDDERGEGWAHFVLVSQGLLARVPSSDFPQIRATTKSYCCTQLELQHTYLSLEVLPAGQGAERCSWCEISGEAFLHESTMNSALYPSLQALAARRSTGLAV